MDSGTLEYYRKHAADLIGRYNTARGGVANHFTEAFPAGSSVLDMGFGTGRDIQLLLTMGYDAYGIDGSADMAEQAIHSYPELASRVRVASIPSAEPYFGRTFDCVLCSAVLMHITDDHIREAVMTVRRSLREGGTFLLSVPTGRPGLDADGRDASGRLFVIRTLEFYTGLLATCGLNLLKSYNDRDGLGRTGIEWISGLYG